VAPGAQTYNAAVAGAVIGAAGGAVVGATIGALVGGPVGAVIGAVVGAAVGALVGMAIAISMAKNAARITDYHLCPMVDPGPKPHVGGNISSGFPTVQIVGLAGARLSDTALCAGPPDAISSGSGSVIVGGMPAARISDSTLHGGKIVAGAPTVVFGGPVNIQGDAAFAASAVTALERIYSTKSGREIFRSLAESGRKVTIQPGGNFCRPHNVKGYKNPGVGSDSTVGWDPNVSHSHADPPDVNVGSEVILGHELIHATHNANGTNANGPYDLYPGQSKPSARGEERVTVGLPGGTITQPDRTPAAVPDFSNDFPTENSMREELGIPLRPSYYSRNWPGGPPW